MGAIDQLDRHVASLLANEHAFVITSLAPPGVVIQLDGHGAERLAMTFSGFIATITQARACSKLSRWQSRKWFIALSPNGSAFVRPTRDYS
jgi:hypothetical protein